MAEPARSRQASSCSGSNKRSSYGIKEPNSQPTGNENTFCFDPKYGSLARNRDDIVGKRVLCVPRTFHVSAPSPISLPSSFWSSDALAKLEGKASACSRFWRTCPVHDQLSEELTRKIQQQKHQENADNSGTLARQMREIRRLVASHKKASENYRGSYSMMKTKLQQHKGELPQMYINKAKCDPFPGASSQLDGNLSENLRQRLHALPWRLGTIRAVSHRDLEEHGLSVMIEFDLLDWQTRDWYHVRDKNDDEDSADEDADPTIAGKVRAIHTDGSIGMTAKRNRSEISDEEDASSRSKQKDDQAHKKREKQVDTDNDSPMTEIFAEPQTYEENEDSNEKRTSGAFSVLLIESSICCLNRQQAPTGHNKLWPALTFEPLVDELGLFDVTCVGEVLKAVEYIDPDAEHENVKTTKQSACDIKEILAELEAEFSNGSGSTDNRASENVDGNFTTSRSLVGRKDPVPPEVSNNDSKCAISAECICWSPRVEFVEAESIYRLLKEEPSIRKNANDEQHRSNKKVTANKVKPQLRAPSQIDGGSASTSHGPSNYLSSWRKFLRSFHQTKLTEAAKVRVRGSSGTCPTDSGDLRALNWTDGNEVSSGNSSNDNVNDDSNGISNITYTGRDYLVEAIIHYPQLYQLLRAWHLYQDAQSLLGNVYTAALLVGNRVRVYRSSGTTQWYTAVIISYDEKSNLLTLIDDTVLEEHHEDPTLLEMHLIDDGLIQSIIEGDDATSIGSTRRRTQRANQRQAAKTAQIAIMNSSNQLPANGASSGVSALISKQLTKGLSSGAHSSSALVSLSPSTSATSSCSSSAAPAASQPQIQSTEAVTCPLSATPIQPKTNSNSVDGATSTSSSNSSSRQMSSSTATKINNTNSNKDAIKSGGKGKRCSETLQSAGSISGFGLTSDDGEGAPNQHWSEPWTGYRCEDELHTPQLQIKTWSSTEGRTGSGSRSRQQERLIGVGVDQLQPNVERRRSTESHLMSPTTSLLSRAADSVKLGNSKGVTVGKNFLSHRLRLEALEATRDSCGGGSVEMHVVQSGGDLSPRSNELAKNKEVASLSNSLAPHSSKRPKFRPDLNKSSLSSLNEPPPLHASPLRETTEAAQVAGPAGYAPEAGARAAGGATVAAVAKQQPDPESAGNGDAEPRSSAASSNNLAKEQQQPLKQHQTDGLQAGGAANQLLEPTDLFQAPEQQRQRQHMHRNQEPRLELEGEEEASGQRAKAEREAEPAERRKKQHCRRSASASASGQVQVDCDEHDYDDDRESHEERKLRRQQKLREASGGRSVKTRTSAEKSAAEAAPAAEAPEPDNAEGRPRRPADDGRWGRADAEAGRWSGDKAADWHSIREPERGQIATVGGSPLGAGRELDACVSARRSRPAANMHSNSGPESGSSWGASAPDQWPSPRSGPNPHSNPSPDPKQPSEQQQSERQAPQSQHVSTSSSSQQQRQTPQQQQRQKPQTLQHAFKEQPGAQASESEQQRQQKEPKPKQSTLAPRVDQIAERTTLQDSPHMPLTSSSNANCSTDNHHNNLAPMLFNSATVASTAQSFTAPQEAGGSNTSNAASAPVGSQSVSAASFTYTSSSSSTVDTPPTTTPAATSVASTMSAARGSANVSSNNNNNSNLAPKTAAHSASHSALAAAAALQSLNQSHLHSQQQLAQLHHYQQQQSTRPPSNPPPASASAMPKLGVTSTTSSDHQNHNHLALGNLQRQDSAPSEPTSATSSHLLLLEESARFQQLSKLSLQPPSAASTNTTNSTTSSTSSTSSTSTSTSTSTTSNSTNSIRPPPPVNWQTPPLDQHQPPGPPRWLYTNPYATFPSPAHSFSTTPSSSTTPTITTSSSSSLSTSAVSNFGNSNNMIGQEGDNPAAATNNAAALLRNMNNAGNNNNNSNNNNSLDKSDRQTTPANTANQFNPSSTTHLEAAAKSSLPNNNSLRSSYGSWLDNKNGQIIEASKVQNQLISEGYDKNLAERLGLMTYNFNSNLIVGTNKPKKFVYLDNIDGCRTTILKGEFYTKYEDVVAGILTNQLLVPEISIIDYLKRVDLSLSELEKIDTVHKRCLGVSDYLCLLELTNRRNFQHIAKVNEIKQQQNFLSQHLPPNLNIGTANFQSPHNHQFNHLSTSQDHLTNSNPLLATLPGGKLTDSSLSALEKNKRSSHSPSDSLPRSLQPSNNNGPGNRIINAHSSSHHPSYPPIGVSHLPPPVIGQRGHPRSSPHQPLIAPNAFTPRPPPPKSSPAIAHESPLGMAGAPSSAPRQPPAAHQSSARPNIMVPGPHMAHAHSSASSNVLSGPPVTAHMSSKTPQTPRLHTQESHAKSSHIDTHSPNRLSDERLLNKGPFGSGTVLGGNPMTSNQNTSSSFNPRTDIDPMTGLPVHTLLSLKQQELVNRELALKRTGTPHYLNNPATANLMIPPHQLNMTSNRSPSSDPHLNSRSPMNSQFQSIYGPHPNNMSAASPMFKSPSGQSNFPGNSSMRPPSSEYHKPLSLTDINRLNETSRSSMMSPNISNLSNEAQLKQYSALMNAYQHQQQHQQQHLMMVNKSSANQTNPLVIGLNQGGFNNHHSPSLRSPQASNDAMLMDVQNQREFYNQDSRQISRQPSPKQNQNQRSIITGAAATGPKRNKKAKQSPPNSLSCDLKHTIPTSLSQNENLPAMNLINSSDHLNILNSRTEVSPQQQPQQFLTNNNGNAGDSSRVDVTENNGLLVASNAPLYPTDRGQPDDLSAMKLKNPNSSDSTNLQQVKSMELQFQAALAHSSTPSIVNSSQSDMVNAVGDAAHGHANVTDLVQNIDSYKSRLEDKSLNVGANNQSESAKSDTDGLDAISRLSNSKFGNNSSNNDSAKLDSNSNTVASTAQIPVEQSKYQKLYTKKAWLKNYDQEESKTGTDASMTIKTEMKAQPADITPAVTKDSKIAATNETKDTKPLAKGTDSKKKTKELPNKKANSSRPNRNVKQVNDNESEISNASTSDLDSDETESSKSTSDKKLRRMPRRKVKPSVEKEEHNSPKSKLSKEINARKSSGKRDKCEKPEVSSGKRKNGASGVGEANLRKSKKAKLSAKQTSAKGAEEQKVSRRQAAAKVSSSKGENIDESESKSTESKRSTPRASKAKDQVGESKSSESQSDNETLYSSVDSEEGSLPSDEAKSSSKKSKKSVKKDPKGSVSSPTSKMFLQTDPCYDIVPKSIRCLECRRVRQSSLKSDKVLSAKQSKTNWDDFCRFYEFRKLRYNKASQIVVAGFSDLDDAKESDKTLWLPQTSGIPTNFTYSIAKFILSNVGNEFCDLVVQERSVRDSYLALRKGSGDEKITWKRAVNGLRELCDVCATTLFNCHYFCERCGFVVCIDCYQSRAKAKQASGSNIAAIKKENDSGDDLSDAPLKIVSDTNENCLSETPENSATTVTKKSKRDSCGWIFCAKNEEHYHEKLKLTQIIAGDCLEEVWSLLHEVRERLSLGACNCRKETSPNKLERCDSVSSKDTSTNALFIHDDMETNSEGSHSTLKGLLLATNNGLLNSEERGSTQDGDAAMPTSDSFKRDTGSITSQNNYSSSPLNDEKMFNDSSNEDDLQEDTKLSEQVTAAIEGCISSLPNGSDGDSPIRLMSPLSNLTNRATLPQIADSSPSNLSGQQNSNEWRKWKKDDHELGYYWLCQGDLLVLTQESHAKNIKLFRQQWLSGRPVLIRGIEKLMKIDMWRPQFFGKEFGDYRSDLVDCRNGDIHRHSMKKYWEGFEPTLNGANAKKKFKDDSIPTQIPAANNEECSNGPSYYSGSALWRLKDWPPGQDFYEILPSHYEDFMNNLPLKDYTTRSGKLNLACRLPKEMLKPDLGPKMYSAYGTIKFPERGTTNLHLDISDAINVMVYVNGATSFKNGSDEIRENFEELIEEVEVDAAMKAQVRNQKLVPGALWHVFRPEDSQCIRDFLNKVSDERNISPEKRNDPIHDQTWYLDQYLLDRLFLEYKVKSFPILQCMGDAILIPAGAPHQVKNLQNCIKVANDFVSPENVRYCLKLTNEFRSLPETHMNQEDKLQIKNILYHSVKESLQYIKLYESGKLDLNDKSKIEGESVE